MIYPLAGHLYSNTTTHLNLEVYDGTIMIMIESFTYYRTHTPPHPHSQSVTKIIVIGLQL